MKQLASVTRKITLTQQAPLGICCRASFPSHLAILLDGNDISTLIFNISRSNIALVDKTNHFFLQAHCETISKEVLPNANNDRYRMGLQDATDQCKELKCFA